MQTIDVSGPMGNIASFLFFLPPILPIPISEMEQSFTLFFPPSLTIPFLEMEHL